MAKKILGVIKKVIFGLVTLYTFNLIAMPLNIIIGINLVTVSAVSFLGLPGLMMFIILKLFV